eukprot:1176514-Prorocentrum_minimum.AAC.1
MKREKQNIADARVLEYVRALRQTKYRRFLAKSRHRVDANCGTGYQAAPCGARPPGILAAR